MCIVVAIRFGPVAIVFDPSPKSLSTHLPTYCQRQPVVSGFGIVGFVVDCTLVDHSLLLVKSSDAVGYHNSGWGGFSMKSCKCLTVVDLESHLKH